MSKENIHVRAGDRVIFKDGFEREGIVLEVSPSGNRVKIQYGDTSYPRQYWYKWQRVVELLTVLPKKRWFS